MAVLGAMGGASSSPTKSEGDSAVLEGLVQAKDGGEAIPPVVARFFFGRQHLTFDKGGKFSARRGDSAENLIDGADGEQSPPSRLGIVSEL